MNDPLITVIVPVYNGERYLAAAIESILRQTWRAVETIVIDDGSTDQSAAVARSFAPRVKYELVRHGGAGAAAIAASSEPPAIISRFWTPMICGPTRSSSSRCIVFIQTTRRIMSLAT